MSAKTRVADKKSPPRRQAYPFDEAMTLIGLSRREGYRAFANGRLDTYLYGRRRFVSQRAIDACIAQHERIE